ncbi:MAG: hypothetical protein ACREV9_17785 [Burkholderiales bacterium]
MARITDWSVWDVLDEFSLHDAGFLWCEEEPLYHTCMIMPNDPQETIRRKADLISHQLMAAASCNPPKLQATKRYVRDDMYTPQTARWIASRSALKEWAKSNGMRPRFLFPEVPPLDTTQNVAESEVAESQASAGRDPENESRREQQLSFIETIIAALEYDAHAIPEGGKQEIKRRCLMFPKLFTDAGFEHAWKEGNRQGRFEIKDKNRFTKKW